GLQRLLLRSLVLLISGSDNFELQLRLYIVKTKYTELSVRWLFALEGILFNGRRETYCSSTAQLIYSLYINEHKIACSGNL
ncbi:hypothetical protein L9F63_022913, partial [Diploptera punctata]